MLGAGDVLFGMHQQITNGAPVLPVNKLKPALHAQGKHGSDTEHATSSCSDHARCCMPKHETATYCCNCCSLNSIGTDRKAKKMFLYQEVSQASLDWYRHCLAMHMVHNTHVDK